MILNVHSGMILNLGELGRTWANLGELGRTFMNLGEHEHEHERS